MLSNATILRIDTPSAIGADGTMSYAAGAAISVRCAADTPKESQHWSFGALIKDANAVIYVRQADLPAGVDLVVRGRGMIQIDGQAAYAFEVLYKIIRVKALMTHYECFLKAV